MSQEGDEAVQLQELEGGGADPSTESAVTSEDTKIDVKEDLVDGSEKPSQKKEIIIPDCPVHSVVVYPDRAEVSYVALLLSCWNFHFLSILLCR